MLIASGCVDVFIQQIAGGRVLLLIFNRCNWQDVMAIIGTHRPIVTGELTLDVFMTTGYICVNVKPYHTSQY